MFKKIIPSFVKLMQKIIITAALFFIYILGFGITLILVTIFNRKLLGIKRREEDTFWVKAEGYEADIDQLIRES